MTDYNPISIINNANESYKNNNLEEAQMCYQSALLDWVDDAREMENSGQDISTMKDSITTLWIEYAKLNATANMVCFSFSKKVSSTVILLVYRCN